MEDDDQAYLDAELLNVERQHRLDIAWTERARESQVRNTLARLNTLDRDLNVLSGARPNMIEGKLDLDEPWVGGSPELLPPIVRTAVQEMSEHWA